MTAENTTRGPGREKRLGLHYRTVEPGGRYRAPRPINVVGAKVFFSLGRIRQVGLILPRMSEGVL